MSKETSKRSSENRNKDCLPLIEIFERIYFRWDLDFIFSKKKLYSFILMDLFFMQFRLSSDIQGWNFSQPDGQPK